MLNDLCNIQPTVIKNEKVSLEEILEVKAVEILSKIPKEFDLEFMKNK